MAPAPSPGHLSRDGSLPSRAPSQGSLLACVLVPLLRGPHGLQSIQARPSESARTEAVSNMYVLRAVEVLVRLSETGLGVGYSYRHVPPGFPDQPRRGGAGLLLFLPVDVLYPRSA